MGFVVVVHRFSYPLSIWDLPGPGIELMSPCIGQLDSYPLYNQGSPVGHAFYVVGELLDGVKKHMGIGVRIGVEKEFGFKLQGFETPTRRSHVREIFAGNWIFPGSSGARWDLRHGFGGTSPLLGGT